MAVNRNNEPQENNTDLNAMAAALQRANIASSGTQDQGSTENQQNNAAAGNAGNGNAGSFNHQGFAGFGAPQHNQYNDNTAKHYWGGTSPYALCFSQSAIGGQLGKLADRFAEAWKVIGKNTPNLTMDILSLPRDNYPEMPVNGLVFIMVAKDTKMATFYGMAVSADQNQPVFEQYPDGQVKIETFIGDLLDKSYMMKLHTFVENRLRLSEETAGVKLLPGNCAAFDPSFNAEDDNQILMAIVEIANAQSSVMNSFNPNFQDLNLARTTVVNPDSKGEQRGSLVQNIEFAGPNDDTHLSPGGAPTRADIRITSSFAPPKMNGNVQPNVPLGLVTGYLDVQPTGSSPTAQQARNYAIANNQTIPAEQMFISTFVITDMKFNGPTTLSYTLLCLMLASQIGLNNHWKYGFDPASGGKRAIGEKHCVSGIGYELAMLGEKGKPFDLTALQGGQFYPWFDSWFYNGVKFAIDVSTSDISIWRYSTFLLVAQRNKDATNELMAALENLFNGYFIEEYNALKGTGQFFTIDDGGNSLHGDYTDNRGVKHDLRDLDYLMLANLLGENNNTEFMMMTDPSKMTRDPRSVASRCNVIRNLLPSANITGRGVRLVVEPAFMMAMCNAATRCGVNFNTNNGNVNGMSMSRWAMNPNMIFSANNNTLFTAGGMNGAGNTYYGQNMNPAYAYRYGYQAYNNGFAGGGVVM